MQHIFIVTMLGGALAGPLLSWPTQAQTSPSWTEQSAKAPDVVSVRDCRPPADAKEAQVLAFDKVTLEAKLAVSLGKDEFKVVTVKLWDHSQDPRPLSRRTSGTHLGSFTILESVIGKTPEGPA